MIELIDIGKSFSGSPALGPLSLRIAPQRSTVLIGPSGCGKSTLLRLIAGLLMPDSGRILFDGETVGKETLARLRLRIGYVIQEGGLFPHLSVARNIALMARHLRWPAARITERIEQLCALTHFPEDLLLRFPGELSGGQRQRVSLMRALMLDPDVLLLDEPLAALDPMVRYEVQQELKSVFSSLGKTVLLVTHDISEAAQLGDSLVLLRRGQIVQQGSLQALARTPNEPFVTQFIAAQREPIEQLLKVLG